MPSLALICVVSYWTGRGLELKPNDRFDGLGATVLANWFRAASDEQSREPGVFGHGVCYGAAMSNAVGEARDKRVVRDVSVATLRDLVESPPRATVAFTDGGEVDVVPVRARCTADTYEFGVASDTAPNLDHREVVLVIDAGGNSWFMLRGFSVRGVAVRVALPASERSGLTWYAIDPQRILAWDYGSIREECNA